MSFKLEGLRILVRVRIGNHNDLKKSTVLKLKIIDRNRLKLGLENSLREKDYFTEIEGRAAIKDPNGVVFTDYVEKWFKEMEPGMGVSMIRDYTSILNSHHISYFSGMPFSEFTLLQMKKFVATLKGKKNQFDRPLSAKRIQNIMIPLRAIVKDAIDEYSWLDFADPFAGLKLPKPKKDRR